MSRRFLCECYRQGIGSHEIITFVNRKSAKIKGSEKKVSKWMKDDHNLHKRH